MRRFVAHRMALLAIPPGTPNPFAAGVAVLANPGIAAKNWTEAVAWCCAAVDAVKSAPDNPFGDDDEAIAAEILRGIVERQRRA